MISFVARNESLHLSTIRDEYEHETDYLYGSLYIWKVFTKGLTPQDMDELLRKVARVEEFIDVNMEDDGDVKIDGGWIRSSLNSLIEGDPPDTGTRGPDRQSSTSVDVSEEVFNVMSVHEERLMKEIAEAFDIDIDSNQFKSVQRTYHHYGTPRRMMSNVLIEVANNTFSVGDHSEDEAKGSMSKAFIVDNSLLDNFTISIHCDESETIGGSVCIITVSLLDDDISVSKYYHNLKDVIQLMIETKQLVTKWALFYYSVTNRLSVATLPSIIGE